MTRIAFLSDFGTTDEFVGVVHAVLAAHAPAASRIDLTHQIPAHDIRAGALTLWRAAPWLAPGVILGVVDPGVGTERRAVAIEVATEVARAHPTALPAAAHPAAAQPSAAQPAAARPAGAQPAVARPAPARTVLVGPDNGLLLPAAHLLGPITTAVELPPNPDAPGATFAGRDVFAPAAGRAAAGTPVAELGRPVDPATLIGRPVPEPVVTGGGEVEAEVLWVDRFGNAQLGAIPAPTGQGPLEVRHGEWTATLRTVTSYGAIAPDDAALVVDSYGFLSLCCDRRSAAERLRLGAGDRVRLCPDPDRHR